MPLRVAFSGCRPPTRNGRAATLAERHLYHRIAAEVRRAVAELPEGAIVVHGARDDAQHQNGVDAIARDAARARGLVTEAHPPDYAAFAGREGEAPLARNAYVTGCDRLEAFAAPWSTGTHDSIRKAEAAGVPVVRHDEGPAAVRPLEVWTAPLRSGDLDELDVSRATADQRMKARAKAIDNGVALADVPPLVELYRDARRRTDRGATLAEVRGAWKTAGWPALGAPWAPDWSYLNPALAALERADKLRNRAFCMILDEEAEKRLAALAQAEGIEATAWATYERAYAATLHASWREARPAWLWVLGLRRVVIACRCPRERALRGHCHRVPLAAALGKLGADVRGELPELA